MGIAKIISEDEEGYVILFNELDYEKYIQELQEWLEKNQDKIMDFKEKPIKQFILTKEIL